MSHELLPRNPVAAALHLKHGQCILVRDGNAIGYYKVVCTPETHVTTMNHISNVVLLPTLNIYNDQQWLVIKENTVLMFVSS